MRIRLVRCLCLGLAILATTAVAPTPALAIPAFARKYGLPCSACHEAWPKLNNFGQVFRDNGYQLGNDRDAAIYQAPSYWPSTIRITPQWHRETTNRATVDTVPGDANSGLSESRLKASGFDLSGLDLITAGTLAKNISFLVLPASDETGAFHFEAAWVRFDNLLGSHWLNLKFGKHELDLPVSEHRSYTLSGNGGYQTYHFAPANPLLPFVPGGQVNSFGGIGDNQLGLELAGHSKNSYTRYAFSVLSNNAGNVALPSSGGYDYYAHFSQAFELRRLGLQRVGAYAYFGQAPTYYLTSGGEAIAGAGKGDRSFYRAGAYGQWYVGKFSLSTLYMHGRDSAFLGTGTPANQPFILPAGARSPNWNGGFAELQYNPNPQMVFFGRYELIRMSQQAFPIGTLLNNGQALTHNFGNTDAYVAGYRWYPLMISRGGLAWHQEYSWVRNIGAAPISGLNVVNTSFLMGLDFAF
jgi:hypothetical protein